MAVTLHVEQRVLDHYRVVQLGMLGQGQAHQQSTVAAAADAQMLRTGHAVFNQLLCDRGEIVVDALPVLLQSRAVPLRSKLTAAANIAEDKDPTTLEPRRPGGAVIARRIGDFESAVRREQRGVAAVALHGAAVNDEERDLRAVL